MCLAMNTVPESGASAETDSEEASGLCTGPLEIQSALHQVRKQQRYLLQNVQLLNHKEGRLLRKREKSIQSIATSLSAQQTYFVVKG